MAFNQSPLVSGEIFISKEIFSFYGATARIYLEDVDLLDTAAKTVAQQTIANLSHEAGTEDKVAFTISGGTAEAQKMYSIRVHITVHGNKAIHRGDYVSTASYPVLTQGHPNYVLVKITEVK